MYIGRKIVDILNNLVEKKVGQQSIWISFSRILVFLVLLVLQSSDSWFILRYFYIRESKR